jgi:hypothetical protein
VPCNEISFECPLGVAKYIKRNTYVLLDVNTNSLSVGVCAVSSNIIKCKLDNVNINTPYAISGSLSYEML